MLNFSANFDMTKNLNDEKALNDIANADVMLKERGMLSYMRFTDKEMSEIGRKILQRLKVLMET